MRGRLEVVGLTKAFAGLVAVDDVTLEVHPGEIVGLIGPNGAGKTTVFNCIMGFLRPTAGDIRFQDEDITMLSPPARAARGMARTFQQPRLFGHLDVAENLLLGLHLRYGVTPLQAALGTPAARRAEARARATIEELAAGSGLGPVLGARVGALSHGTRRLVEIVRALAGDPAILLLDEPGAGLDGDELSRLLELLRRFHAEHKTSIVLIDHDVPTVLSLCQWVYVLDFGRVIAEGLPAGIARDERVRAAYLGRAGVANG